MLRCSIYYLMPSMPRKVALLVLIATLIIDHTRYCSSRYYTGYLSSFHFLELLRAKSRIELLAYVLVYCIINNKNNQTDTHTHTHTHTHTRCFWKMCVMSVCMCM